MLPFRTTSLALGALALLAAACGQNDTLVTPATFERPGDIAFVCYDTETRLLVELGLCENPTGTLADRYALTGLVTQTASGEVGAIDFRQRRVLDANFQVPGFTFTRVGEFPSAIVVPADDPGVTYVASFGSRRVEYYRTMDFRNDVAAGPEIEPGSVPLPGGPTDLALAPDGSMVYAAVPSMGLVVPIPIQTDRSLPAMVDMADALVPTVPVDLPTPVPGLPTVYDHLCKAEAGVPDAADVRTTVMSSGDLPQPHQLVVTEQPDGSSELLVADRALPLIHRFLIGAGGALTELEPLAPGVPVRELTVSPVVPLAAPAAAMPGDARYLYAIDDTDQSVLVMDYLPSSPTFGAVLPVQFGPGDSDRLRLAGAASSLDVIVRAYDEDAPDFCTTPDGGEAPLNLRGVFLAVGLANGFLQVVDVVDLDGPCRGNDPMCGGPDATDGDEFVYIQRHRPRVASFQTEAIETRGSPILTVDGVGHLADTASGEAHIDGLLPVMCLSGQRHVFGNEVCATADPWALRSEIWRATWEGTIPGTTELVRRDGMSNVIELATEGAAYLCDRGVLGSDDIRNGGLAQSDPERSYTGDYLIVTTEPDESVREIMAGICEPFFEPDDGTEREVLELPIVRAFADHVEIGPSREDGFLLDTCYGTGALFGVAVRLDNAFLVSGSQTGFLHRVVADETTGACRVDIAGQPIDPDDATSFVNGRAFAAIPGDPMAVPPTEAVPRPYQNPFIAFTLEPLAVNEAAELQINLTTVPATFAVPVGDRPGRNPVTTIVEQVVYSPTDEHLYVLDSNSSSLVRYQTDQFQLGNVFE